MTASPEEKANNVLLGLAAAAIAYGKTKGTTLEKEGEELLQRAAIEYFEAVRDMREGREN